MKRLFIFILLILISTATFADTDKSVWDGMTIEQRVFFVMGFFYGIYTEDFENTDEDTYNLEQLNSDKVPLIIKTVSALYAFYPEMSLREAILSSLELVMKQDTSS